MLSRGRLAKPLVLASLCLAAGFLASVYATADKWRPIGFGNWVRQQLAGPRLTATYPDPRARQQFDEFGRLVDAPGKKSLPCPQQDARTAVLLLLGQSNAGNHAGQKYRSNNGDRVLNYHDGRCFIAESPLLGATGTQGESWTLLGSRLVDSGIYSRVILVPLAIDGVPIRRWREGGDLYQLLRRVGERIGSDYRVTHVVWHQGERDFDDGTSQQDYRATLESVLSGVRRSGITAPVFVSVATRCTDRRQWRPENPVAMAQRAAPRLSDNVFPGVDSDALIEEFDRFDGCHFSARGQEKFAAAWATLIIGHHQPPNSQ